ncbi:MAG: serine/threonine-protein kinase [Acidobacteriaceae bacterium]|nr:serine/threonine-protein kinase [Acidobacteriaceae bacterium]
MALAAGDQLGPYEVIASIGAGGMGEVYRARDSRLERDIALKVLPQYLGSDANKLRRFEKEARALAALNHPNILAVFDIGESSGMQYIVSELLEGETLAQRLKEGPIGSRKAIEYATQIARGLSAAHERGIVHRDLKPENILLTRDGVVKILDFGIAKQARSAEFSDARAATVTRSATDPGVVLGTAAYMSPEQVRGMTADHRSDIFSFGSVLYEMLVGKRAFPGESSIETMNAILNAEPADIEGPVSRISPGLERIVRHCLEKNPADRFQSTRDLAFALSALSGSDSSAQPAAVPGRTRMARYWWAVVCTALLAVAALVAYRVNGKRPYLRPMHFAIPLRNEVTNFAIAPDGRFMAFVSPDEVTGVPVLFIRGIGSDTQMEVPGSDGASYPFWSPDDSHVAYFAHGKLIKASADGIEQHILASVAAPRGGSWGRKNVIIYSPDASGPLWRINADGTGVAPLTQKIMAPAEASHRWPLFLPDGDHFLFWGYGDPTRGGTFLSSLDKQEKRFIVSDRSNVGFAAPGTLFYINLNNQLVSQNFDYRSGKVSGEPHLIARSAGYEATVYWSAFSVSESGTLILNAHAGGTQSALTWYDRTGKELGAAGSSGSLSNPAIAPDGRAVAYDMWSLASGGTSDIWTSDLVRNTAAHFSFEQGEATTPIWSPDGKYIAFRVVADFTTVMVKPASGLEPASVIARVRLQDDLIPASWSPDGKYIVCMLERVGRSADLVLISVGEHKLIPFLSGAGNQLNPQISPDGKWVAYSSTESGQSEIYVTSFPSAAGKWQISQGGGTEPRWRADGKELFFIGEKEMLMSSPISAGDTFSSGTPQPLFQVHSRAPISNTDLFSYDVSKDGERFLVNRYVKPAYVPPLEITLNATAADAR